MPESYFMIGIFYIQKSAIDANIVWIMSNSLKTANYPTVIHCTTIDKNAIPFALSKIIFNE